VILRICKISEFSFSFFVGKNKSILISTNFVHKFLKKFLVSGLLYINKEFLLIIIKVSLNSKGGDFSSKLKIPLYPKISQFESFKVF
jgi:hypothetical protein